MIAVWHVAVAGITVEVLQRSLQGVFIHFHAALLGKEQEGDHVHAGGIDVPARRISPRHTTPLGPGSVVHGPLGAFRELLDQRKHRSVAGAQVIFTEAQAGIAAVLGMLNSSDVGVLVFRHRLFDPTTGDFQILLFACGKHEEQTQILTIPCMTP